MAGEIGVMFNIPQPFTVRTKRLSQVVRISHNHLKQVLQADHDDGKKIISNYIGYLKSLKHNMLEELPFLTDLLSDMNIQLTAMNEEPQNPEASNSQQDADVTGVPGAPEPSSPSLSIMLIRVIIHGHHPDTNTTEGDTVGKLILLPASIEDLFKLAGIRVSNDKAYISLPRRPNPQ